MIIRLIAHGVFKTMTSQDVQSFFQPLSSWMSRVFEAVQQAGDSLSSSLSNLGTKVDNHTNTEEDEDLEDSHESYDRYSEGSDDESTSSQRSGESDCFSSSCRDPVSLESSCASDLGLYGQEREKSSLAFTEQYFDDDDDDTLTSRGVYQSYMSHQAMETLPTIPEEEEHLSSKQINIPCKWNDRPSSSVKNNNDATSMAVNSYGEDEDLTTSSDSDDEVIKQFEISVSRSQSFRSGVSEKGTQVGSECRPKFNRLLSNHEECSTDASECEDLDGFSHLSYQDNLSYRDDDHLSLDSRTASESRGSGQPKDPETEISATRSLSRQETEGSLEMETAFSNQGFEGNDATDSSSAWSPEEHEGASALPAHSSTHEPISKCGDLDVLFDYKPSSQKLFVTILEAKDIPDKDRSGASSWQVHVVLMPSKKQRGKTSIQRGPNPLFQDKITFTKLVSEELSSYALRFRLYSVRKMIKERMMGERLFYLRNLNQEGEMKVTLVLEPRSNLCSGGSQLSLSAISHSDSASSTQSLSHGGVPELLVGLSYNATTGRLSVEMIKGSHFRNLAINRPPDTYGKLCLLNSVGQEMSRCKTSVRRGQPNPVYKETFVFQVALFQLSDVTLMVSIYNRRSIKRKEMIGWLSMGQNSSGEEELSHWQEMKESGPRQVLTNSLTTSKVAYFKRKYAEEEDLHQDYKGYFPKHLILPEDRTCILKLSLQKLQFLEDPEIYLRRSVLINNLLRKIHLETERERYEYFKGSPCCRTAYSDARKRLKFMVEECHSQSLYYEELHSFHIVPYPTENAIYGVGYSSSHLKQNSQLLIYQMK